jgi:hypothetical protein
VVEHVLSTCKALDLILALQVKKVVERDLSQGHPKSDTGEKRTWKGENSKLGTVCLFLLAIDYTY